MHFIDIAAVPISDGDIDKSREITYSGNIEKQIETAKYENIKCMIVVSHDIYSSKKSIDFCTRVGFNQPSYGGNDSPSQLKNEPFLKVFCTIGIDSTCDGNVLEQIYELEQLIIDHRDIIVGIGKIGLEIEDTFVSNEDQSFIFQFQVELAKKYNLPMIISERTNNDSFNELKKILKKVNYYNGVYLADIMSKDDQYETVKLFLSLGIHIGIEQHFLSGWDKNIIPLDQLHLMSMNNYNSIIDPNFNKVVQKFSEIYNKDKEEIASLCIENSKKMFGI